MKKTTLCLVINQAKQEILMIQKKRGQGAGKWNFPGGKIAAGESSEAAAIRECVEETGIIPQTPKQLGVLEFLFTHENSHNSWNNICSIFYSESFSGTMAAENEECTAHWVSLNAIPYEKMWDDDKLWVPLALKKRYFHRQYIFDQNHHMVEEKILDGNT